MKKIKIIKKNKEFTNIITSEKPINSKYFLVFQKKNKYKFSRFGITVQKKRINAVKRNKLKRQIKNIIDEKIYEKSIDYIIIIKKEALYAKFLDLKVNLEKIIK